MVEQRAGWTPPRLGTREQRALSWLATVEPPSGIVLQPSLWIPAARASGSRVHQIKRLAKRAAAGGDIPVSRGTRSTWRGCSGGRHGGRQTLPGLGRRTGCESGGCPGSGSRAPAATRSGTTGPTSARWRRSIGGGWRTAARFPRRAWRTGAGSAASRGSASRAGWAMRGAVRRGRWRSATPSARGSPGRCQCETRRCRRRKVA